MRIKKLVLWLSAVIVYLATSSVLFPMAATAAIDAKSRAAEPATEKLDNATCLICHGTQAEKLTVRRKDGKVRALRAIEEKPFEKGIHGEMTCVACHLDITSNKAPHKKGSAPKANCVTCHQALWETVKEEKLTQEKARLGIVVQNIDAYKNSYHARPSADDKTLPNAACDNCHDSHYFNVPPRGTSKRTEWHLTVPKVCGEQCHTEQIESYAESVHGTEVMDKKNPKAAVCTDCHTTHNIANTSKDVFKLLIIENCGTCHLENFLTYRDTYHGQVTKLGYAYTAKCYDCHDSHKILKVDDPDSKVHPDNRLKTCQECHDGKKLPLATAGFLTFGPHANDHDFERYPQMWIASKFMHWLLLFVFAYFWAHSLLWWYREYRDRQDGKSQTRVRVDELPAEETKQIRRFGPVWRIAHLVFALSVMVLILTGMAVFYSYTDWAPVVMNALGGPKVAGIIHRTSAAIMLGIFFMHLIGVAFNIYRNRKTFRWFGPDSLIPNWKDLRDAWGMFVWFVGKGPRPEFDRWTYWEKFDYWAVFWGMAIIGGSGMLLAFPYVTASIFPGWIFNVASLVHGEEAFLAAVFLFTVHFFNNHFRPDKLPPPDIVMFTGTQSLEEFKRDHALQYQRLVESGELEKYLVDAPSQPMTLGSKILGITLLVCGLILLILVTVGFFGGHTPHSFTL
ncbi:MAG: cytochrome b/b6 domain-containing protein [Sulfuricaulis sp.]|uniref:cytochrome b/b6 domain-containing protein n=1 Tax=Sulfuricaulis sp. TaxID=2003553 RepID=UPI0025CC760A|nr:cytochrome b/b6 domain-containing protein [Sulfuricaulis sp.]MCR4347822.1 cytochrome b/b6 domain-containing protein [Sulfuricaulis sp.]